VAFDKQGEFSQNYSMIKENAHKMPASLIVIHHLYMSFVEDSSFVVLVSSDSMLISSKTSGEVELLSLPYLPSLLYLPNSDKEI